MLYHSIDLNLNSANLLLQHFFKVTIDQVCEAVNTKTKLNFQGENLCYIALHALFQRLVLIMYFNNASTIAMGDEFDGFVDENYERELASESMILPFGFQIAHDIFNL